MKMFTAEIYEIVCKYVKKKEVAIDENLFEIGIDSMNLLFMVNDIETLFSITIPDDELLISNFETIRQICCLVKKIKEGKKYDTEQR